MACKSNNNSSVLEKASLGCYVGVVCIKILSSLFFFFMLSRLISNCCLEFGVYQQCTIIVYADKVHTEQRYIIDKKTRTRHVKKCTLYKCSTVTFFTYPRLLGSWVQIAELAIILLRESQHHQAVTVGRLSKAQQWQLGGAGIQTKDRLIGSTPSQHYLFSQIASWLVTLQPKIAVFGITWQQPHLKIVIYPCINKSTNLIQLSYP